MEEFLIGSSLAILLALIALSDSIRSLHKDTLDLEKEFSKDRELDLRKIRRIIRTQSTTGNRITALLRGKKFILI